MQKNDIGVALEGEIRSGNLVFPVDTATVIDLVLRDPDGAKKTKAGSLVGDGKGGKVRYVTVAGDIDKAGTWSMQWHIVMSGLDIHTNLVAFNVGDNL